ncbi:TPA: DUF4179 domain-containing protein [Bacillus cereus]
MIKKFNKNSYRWSALGVAAIISVSVFSLVNVKAEEPSYKQENPKQELTPVLENQDVRLNEIITDEVRNALRTGDGSIPINQKITDQGITIHLKNLVVSGSNIIGNYTIENENGTLISYEFNTEGLDLLEDGKENSIQVREPIYKLPGYQEGKTVSGPTSTLLFIDGGKNHLAFSLLDSNGKELNLPTAGYEKPDGLFAFTNTEKSPNIRLQINVERIGKIKGNWKGQFLIDVQKRSVQTEEVTENAHSPKIEEISKEKKQQNAENGGESIQLIPTVHKLTDQQRKSLQDRGLPIRQSKEEASISEFMLVSLVKSIDNGDDTDYPLSHTGEIDVIKKSEYKQKYGNRHYVGFDAWE